MEEKFGFDIQDEETEKIKKVDDMINVFYKHAFEKITAEGIPIEKWLFNKNIIY